MRRHAGPDAVAGDVGCIKTGGGGSILKNRRDRVAMQSVSATVEFLIARYGPKDGAFTDV